MTLFRTINGRMAIHRKLLCNLCYNDLIQDSHRPDGHLSCAVCAHDIMTVQLWLLSACREKIAKGSEKLHNLLVP